MRVLCLLCCYVVCCFVVLGCFLNCVFPIVCALYLLVCLVLSFVACFFCVLFSCVCVLCACVVLLFGVCVFCRVWFGCECHVVYGFVCFSL